MYFFRHILSAAIMSLILTASAFANEFKTGDLTIAHPFARATAPGAPVGGGYMKITNSGVESDRLVGASVPFAGKAEIHEMKIQDNVMKMRPVDGGLEIPPGESVELKPGGYHLMFMKLGEQLKEGEKRKATLVFEKAGEIEVELTIEGIAAKKSSEDKMNHTGHGIKKDSDS